MGSADWMPRNLERRVEILFPVLDPAIKEQVVHVLDVQLRDTEKAKLLQPDGTYEKVNRRGKTSLNAQDTFCAEYTKRAKNKKDDLKHARTFIPETHIQE